MLEGELTLDVGAEQETITIGADGFVAAHPASHPHTDNRRPTARWLMIYASDGGFAAFMRGLRDGVKVEWTSHRSRLTAASLQTTRSSVARRPSRLLPEGLNLAAVWRRQR